MHSGHQSSLFQEHSGTFTQQWAQQHAWGQEDQGEQARWRVLAGTHEVRGSWAARVLICPGLPFVSLLSSQTKEPNARMHEFKPPRLQKEKFMVNYLARIQFKKKKKAARSQQSSVRHRLQSIKQQQMKYVHEVLLPDINLIKRTDIWKPAGSEDTANANRTKCIKWAPIPRTPKPAFFWLLDYMLENMN